MMAVFWLMVFSLPGRALWYLVKCSRITRIDWPAVAFVALACGIGRAAAPAASNIALHGALAVAVAVVPPSRYLQAPCALALTGIDPPLLTRIDPLIYELDYG